MIVIIDYKVGNLGSIQNMLKKIREPFVVTCDPNVIAQASKIIFPGVGSFDTGMHNLSDLELIEILTHKVIDEKIPILGICLGMQLFSHMSEEGEKKGLGWIDAEVIKFSFDTEQKLKIPHMGWNYVELKKMSRLFEDMYEEPKFYFVHSYFLKVNDVHDILSTTSFGSDFVSAIECGNILGVQFHPEKSHKYGLKLLTNFAKNY